MRGNCLVFCLGCFELAHFYCMNIRNGNNLIICTLTKGFNVKPHAVLSPFSKFSKKSMLVV